MAKVNSYEIVCSSGDGDDTANDVIYSDPEEHGGYDND